jgi:CheY-like chemotaxis protein
VNLMMVEQLVQLRPNVTLHSAPNGQTGVRLALRLQPELVLVDTSLPDFDGYEVLRRLRENAALSGTTINVLSANALQSDIDRAIAAGFDAYWSRPIEREVFLSCLDALSSSDAFGR